MLELGTNIGYFAVQGGRAAPGVRYVAVEPHPVSAEVCRTHLALNGVTSVELIEAAAVADPAVASVPLLVPADQAATPTVAFLSPDTELPADMARDVAAVLDVPAIDVRRLIDGVDLIKMDVEGQEHLLLGAIRDHLRVRAADPVRRGAARDGAAARRCWPTCARRTATGATRSSRQAASSSSTANGWPPSG